MGEVKNTQDVVGLNVFSIEEGRVLGKTTECVVDLATGKVLGLIVAAGKGQEMGIARGDITSVGRDAVMVSTADVLKPLAEVEDLAEHRTAGETPAPRVLTRSGQVLGSLGIVRVDEACEKVIAYEVRGDVVQAVADGPATLPIIKGTVHGRDAVVLPEKATEAIERPGGLRAWLQKGYDAVREAATEVSEHVTSAAKKVKETAEAGETYYYVENSLYVDDTQGGYFNAEPPMDGIAQEIPEGATVVQEGGKMYFQFDTVFFEQVTSGSKTTYKVVPPPGVSEGTA